jgi:riboflavin synthase
MFTGIITDIGAVLSIEHSGDWRFCLKTRYDTDTIALGASIACQGVCLTVVNKGADWFAVDVSGETMARSTLGRWQVGTRVNLERALKIGDELGGHIVSGHVDAVGTIENIVAEGSSQRFSFLAPQNLAPYLAPKGSVTLDGVSLTLNNVEDIAHGVRFGINIIPHTQEWTTFGQAKAGDAINIEIDMLARYVKRMKDVL